MVKDPTERQKDLLETEAAAKQSMRVAAQGAQQKQGQDSKYLIDPEEGKKRFRKTLLQIETQQVWDQNVGFVEKEVDREDGPEPICNEKCVEDLWVPLEALITPNTAGSNLKRKDIEQEGFQTMKSIILKINVNHEEYGIDSPEDASLIVSAVFGFLLNTLRKAEGARALENQEKSTSESIIKRLDPRQENEDNSGGWF